LFFDWALSDDTGEWAISPDCVHAAACARMHQRMLGIVDGEME
jgi:hypothetical protein